MLKTAIALLLLASMALPSDAYTPKKRHPKDTIRCQYPMQWVFKLCLTPEEIRQFERPIKAPKQPRPTPRPTPSRPQRNSNPYD